MKRRSVKLLVGELLGCKDDPVAVLIQERQRTLLVAYIQVLEFLSFKVLCT